MIEPDKRKAIYVLYEEGMTVREICRQLKVNRKTVQKIVEQKGQMPHTSRTDKIEIDEELVRRLYGECDGWVERVHERLVEEYEKKIGYSTLTRMVRELGLGRKKRKRCDGVADVAGEEMQHDTSPYRVLLGEQRVKVVASLLYYRFSKVGYVKFYRCFERFRMKCFMHEALTYLRFTAPTCIVDNTSLVRLEGTGARAIMVPEMEQFARQFGFAWKCHEIKHANRKAGNERRFWTVETNFFPGRRFASLEDLNRQAFEWATGKMMYRRVGKSRLIPAEAFAYEQPFLKKVPPYVSAPYRIHERVVDQYGNVSFDGNYYWIPKPSQGEVRVLEYAEHIRIYHRREQVAEFALPPYGVKNKQFWPPDYCRPRHRPSNRKKPTAEEEQRLRAAGPEVDEYLNFVLKPKGKERHRVIRELYRLYQKVSSPLFIDAVTRALTYRVSKIDTVENIAGLLLKQKEYVIPDAAIDDELQDRPAYREGRFAEAADLSVYDKLLKETEEEEEKDG